MDDLDQSLFTPYTTESTSRSSSQVTSVVLTETKNTRKVLRSTIVKNSEDPNSNLTIELIHERAGKNGFEAIEPPDLRTLKSGESLSCSLSSSETRALYIELSKLYSLANEFGVKRGTKHYIVLESSDKVSFSGADEKSLSQLLKMCQCSTGFAEKLATVSPELIESAHHYRLLQKKQEGIARFKVMLSERCKEQEWQDFFEEHDWILGGINEVQFLSKVADQPILAGANVFGSNEKRAISYYVLRGMFALLQLPKSKSLTRSF